MTDRESLEEEWAQIADPMTNTELKWAIGVVKEFIGSGGAGTHGGKE